MPVAIGEPSWWVCSWHHATDSNWVWRDDGDYDGDVGGDDDDDEDGDGGDGGVGGDDDGVGGDDDGIVLDTVNQVEIGCSTKMLIIKIVSVVIFETSCEVQYDC